MQRLNYHHLYIFWTLARIGTFTKTAEELSIAQSAVTSQIKSLEDSLGMHLIDRKNRRKPILTEEAKTVLQFANSIFETGNELLNWSKVGTGPSEKVLRIGALSGLSRNLQFEFLNPALTQSNVRIEVITGDQEKLVRLIKEHHLDLILSTHAVPADGRVTLYSNVLTSSPWVCVVGKKNRLKNTSGLADYLTQKRICLPGQSFDNRSEIDAFINRFKFEKNVMAEIDDIALLRLFAVRSDSLVIIPEMGIRSEIESGEVHVVSRPKGLEQKFYVISRQKRIRNAVAEMLIEKMRDA